ncbi:SIMPL domain-containing protein [Gorillibacterium sp. sgz500922]|uniref:SIMPL domain-containing protein n=1 Tax=Gorillibacterium sp. sgz500922 TaxID=3446694 RepID=UPI003F67B28A
MKGWAKTVGAALLASSLILGGMGLSGALKAPEKAHAEEAQKNVIQVTGNGELSVKPDIVYLTIGVDTTAATAQAAQQANAAKMKKVTAVLKDQWKIADKDIQTVQFTVQPNYSYSEKEGQQVKGYNATHTLKVAYRDLDKVGALLDDVSNAGANNIGNASFSVEDPAAFEAQALEKAMANAGVKASAIAKAAKRSLGQVTTVIQQDTGSRPVFYEGAMKAAAATADAAGTSVQAGQVDVTALVTVTYELN